MPKQILLLKKNGHLFAHVAKKLYLCRGKGMKRCRYIVFLLLVGMVGQGCSSRAIQYSVVSFQKFFPSYNVHRFFVHMLTPAIITASCCARKTIRRTRCDASSMPPIPARTTTISSAACIATWAPSAISQVISLFRTTCTRNQPIVFLQITTR